jgi:hypothetical protein
MANLNLLPDYYVKERLRYRVDMICVVLFAIVMAALIVVGKRTERSLEQVHAEHEQIVGQFKETGTEVKDFFALQSNLNKLKKDLNAYEEMRQRVSPSYVLAVIGQVCPETVSLSELQIHRRVAEGKTTAANLPNQKPSASSKAAPYLQISMDGVAEGEEAIGAFVRGIREHPLTKDVNWPMSRSQTIDGETFRVFNMSFVIRTDEQTVRAVRKAMMQDNEAASPESSSGDAAESHRDDEMQESVS